MTRWPACILFLLAMSKSNSEGGAHDLTEEEQILHHQVAMIKKDLEVYCAYPSSQEDWNNQFRDHLARPILLPCFYRPFLDPSRQNQWIFLLMPAKQILFMFIRYYWASQRQSMPLETNPDISTISENDERALRSNYYTPPDTLLPLEIHLLGQNGMSLLFNQNGIL